MSSVARVHKGTAQVPMQLTPQHSPHDSMSFVAEALASTKNIKEFAHTELRSQFPYIKTKDLEKLLAKTTKDLLSGLAEQEQKMRATQSRSSFFSLSAELRNLIYEMALKVEDGIDVSHKVAIGRHTGLLFVSRQIYEEAILIWYSVNTFKFDVGDPYYWPHSNMEPEDRTYEPQDVTKWLVNIGPRASWVTSILLKVDTPDDEPAKILTDLLAFFPHFQRDDLTLHQAVLKSADLLDGDLEPKVFKVTFAKGWLSRNSNEDLYEAAGVDGNELFTAELWGKIQQNRSDL